MSETEERQADRAIRLNNTASDLDKRIRGIYSDLTDRLLFMRHFLRIVTDVTKLFPPESETQYQLEWTREGFAFTTFFQGRKAEHVPMAHASPLTRLLCLPVLADLEQEIQKETETYIKMATKALAAYEARPKKGE